MGGTVIVKVLTVVPVPAAVPMPIAVGTAGVSVAVVGGVGTAAGTAAGKFATQG
jgi:hypothetical protein